jgi:hypothetical protein
VAGTVVGALEVAAGDEIEVGAVVAVAVAGNYA